MLVRLVRIRLVGLVRIRLVRLDRRVAYVRSHATAAVSTVRSTLRYTLSLMIISEALTAAALVGSYAVSVDAAFTHWLASLRCMLEARAALRRTDSLLILHEALVAAAFIRCNAVPITTLIT